MDTNTLIAIGIFAGVVIVIGFLFRAKIKLGVQGPGVGLNVEAEGRKREPGSAPAAPVQQAAGVRIADATSHKGGLLASSDSGIDIQRVDVQDDIIAESKRDDAKKM